ncbi:hypothetical protein TSAR_004253 [Trichomalopsis sarcophagae]|uniref:Uncharacterized protein n=1 Tax=Trichomalopsis sarcophagae TaxID=543379 RepID=A0A232ERI5_9HYME|nr:hypothetical protein TSAR_004253 [Trichomalopsis sarcophagae]
MIQFTYPKISLIEKLIILSLLQKNNTDLNKFMNDTRVSYKVKKNILEVMYTKVEEFHYVLLDLAYQYRYIVKQKVKEYKELFNSNGIITINNAVMSKLLFRYAEEVFYKGKYDLIKN